MLSATKKAYSVGMKITRCAASGRIPVGLSLIGSMAKSPMSSPVFRTSTTAKGFTVSWLLAEPPSLAIRRQKGTIFQSAKKELWSNVLMFVFLGFILLPWLICDGSNVLFPMCVLPFCWEPA